MIFKRISWTWALIYVPQVPEVDGTNDRLGQATTQVQRCY